LAVVERCVEAAAAVPVVAFDVAGEVVAGAFVVGGAVVAGALVVGGVLVAGGHRAGRRVQSPGEAAPAGVVADQSTAALAIRPPVKVSPMIRIQRNIVMGGATLPWTCDRDQHNFAGPDRSTSRR
jgi:hypothetical protein